MAFTPTTKPASQLQAARVELGWKQSQAIAALRRRAEADRVAVAEERSLRTMLSRWENGARVDATYQRLFMRIYGRSSDELGFDTPLSPAQPSSARLAPTAGPELVAYFSNVLAEHVNADNMMGPGYLIEVVRAQADLLDRLIPSVNRKIRDDLVFLACRYNEFAGWLCQDAGDTREAMAFSDRAMDFALELGQPRETAYVLMRKANIAIDSGRPDRAAGLIEAALRDPSQLPPRVRALLFSQQGRAMAARGDVTAAAWAIQRAETEVTRPEAAADGFAEYCNSSYVAMEAAGSWAALGRVDLAIPIYERGLTNWPTGQLRRDLGLCLARLSTAHVGRDDVQSACQAGRRALGVVRSATSGRALAELRQLHTRLAPWRRDAQVSELTMQIRELITA